MIYQLNADYHVRGLQESDANGPYPLWFEDPEVCRFNSHGRFPRTRQYFLDYIRTSNGEDRIVWAMCHRSDGHVGNIALQGISLAHRHAEFAILIGHSGHWGKGLGKLAGRALLGHGFERLNLERIHCGIAETNIGMRKVAQQLGFKEEGRRRRHMFIDREWVDVLDFGILRNEFSLQKK